MTIESWDLQSLYDKAVEFFDKFEFSLSRKFCDKILSNSPNHCEALMLYGSNCLEEGDEAEAKKAFLRLVDVQPSFEAFMSLGEICVGKESIEFYRKGADILTAQHKMASPEEKKHLNRKLSTALCSISEIYLTDCCFEADAEEQIDKSIKEALLLDPANPEVYQTFSNYLISQDKIEEAMQRLNEGYSLWKDLDVSNPECPSYSFRLNSAKLFIELQNYEISFDILEKLAVENDEDVQVWYLFGLSYFLSNQFKFSKECLEMAENLYVKLQEQDEPLIEDIRAMIKEIEEKGISESDEEEEEESAPMELS